jgi:NTE family protein
MPTDDSLALVLSGGGARAAYQAGALLAIAERAPETRFSILTGVSAGSINTAHLAAFQGGLSGAAHALREHWAQLNSDQVYGLFPALLARSAVSRLAKASLGLRAEGPLSAQGLFDTGPLREFLGACVDFSGIEENVRTGRLRAVALSATSYTTGQTVVFVHGGESIGMWERSLRYSMRTRLTLDHVMASCAIPLIFPVVGVDGHYYGDGSVRQTSPLSPAIHLGSRGILAIAPFPCGGRPAPRGEIPSPAEVLSLVFDSIFLDALDADAERMERVNRLIHRLPPGVSHPDGLRAIDLYVLRPSQDLGALVARCGARLPRTVRFLLRTLGGAAERQTAFLSYLLFEPAYTDRLIELGRADALAQWPAIERVLHPEDR